MVTRSSTISDSNCGTLKRGTRTSVPPAQSQHWIQNHVQTIDVIQRQKAKHSVVPAKWRTVRRDELKNIRDQIEMREHHALGKSGGAAGVGKGGEQFPRRPVRRQQIRTN